MKTVLSAILFIILFQLNAQDSIFGEKQLLLETQANSWHELLIPEDFNNDSNIDFIAEIDYDLFMFYSSETNEFSNELLSEFPGDYIDYFDIDLDGDKDIMMEEVYYFKNDGSNNFERDELELNTLWNEDLIYFGDMDMDGLPDIIGRSNTLYGNSKIRVHYNNTGGDFGVIDIAMDSCEIGKVRIVDFNQDGYQDIMLLRDFRDAEYNYRQFLMTLINHGDRSWTIQTYEFSDYISFYSLEIHDFDLDGDKDILLLDNFDKPLIVENINGVLEQPVRLSNNQYHHIKSVDLNADGFMDVVGFDFDFFPNYLVYGYYELNQGGLSFDDRIKIGEVSGFSSISSKAGENYYHLYDVDEDGLQDFVLNAPVDNAVFWFRNKTVVAEPTIITLQPESMIYCFSEDVEIEIQATGTDLSYQWIKDNTELSGQNSPLLIIEDFSYEHEGSYWCRVSGEGGTVISETAQLNLENEAPEFTSGFQDVYLEVDDNCMVQVPDYTAETESVDNCTLDPEITQFPDPGTLLEIGETEVEIMATDESGNTTSVKFNIVVEDNKEPVLNCAQDLQVKANQDQYFKAESELDPVLVEDNCGIELLYNNVNNLETLSGHLFAIGEHQISWNAEDVNGNVSGCDLVLEVLDPTGTKDVKGAMININPNPVVNQVYIKIDGFTAGKLEFYAYPGIRLFELKGNQSGWMLDLSRYAPGLYFVKIYTIERVYTAQLVKI